jgi:hypothetical protein
VGGGASPERWGTGGTTEQLGVVMAPSDEVRNGGLCELEVVKGRASGNMAGQRGSSSGGVA